MKRLVSLLLAATTILSLSACGAQPTTQPSSKPVEQASAASAAPAPAGEKEKIVFWDMNWGSGSDTYIPAAEALVKQFNESQGEVEVEYQSIAWDNYYQVFLTAIKSGAGPDVATAGSQTPIQFAQMGEILPLDSIVEAWKAENSPILKDFMPGFLEANVVDGKTIALPWNADYRVFTYRKDLFEQAGITKLPTNWTEFKDVLKTLKEKLPDKIPFAIYGDMEGSHNLMMWLTIANDTGPVSADQEANFNTPNMQECLQLVADLYDGGVIPEASISYKKADAERLFMSGEACITFGGSQPAFLKDPDFASKIGVLDPMQGPSASKPQSVSWANSIAAYSQTKHPEASKKFIKWWLENNLALWTEGHAGSIPARVSYLQNDYFKENLFSKTAAEKISATFVHATNPVPGFYPAFGQINGERYLGEACQKVLSGRRDFDAIMKEGQESTQAAVEMIKSQG